MHIQVWTSVTKVSRADMASHCSGTSRFVTDHVNCFPNFNSKVSIINCGVTPQRTRSLPDHRSAVDPPRLGQSMSPKSRAGTWSCRGSFWPAGGWQPLLCTTRSDSHQSSQQTHKRLFQTWQGGLWGMPVELGCGWHRAELEKCHWRGRSFFSSS